MNDGRPPAPPRADRRPDRTAQPSIVRGTPGADGARLARDKQAPLGLLVLDLDRLKSLNDQHGHLTGAEAVRTVGRIIGERLPPGAVACRYGGDEFAIAIPACSPQQGRQVAEQLCEAVHESAPVLAGRSFAGGHPVDQCRRGLCSGRWRLGTACWPVTSMRGRRYFRPRTQRSIARRRAVAIKPGEYGDAPVTGLEGTLDMRRRVMAMVLAAWLAVGSTGGAMAVATHATRGVVKSIDASTSAIVRPGKIRAASRST